MPIYAYKCKECETKFEIFHKTKEDTELIICPNCQSNDYKKIMSAASISTSFKIKLDPPAPCGMPGGCQGGSCGLN